LNENVAQILNFLMEKISEEEINIKKEELVQYLLDEGYPLEDIDAAFQLIFAQQQQNVIDLTPLAGVELSSLRQRLLTLEEKMNLTNRATGVLWKVQTTGLLDLQQWEYLLLTLFSERELPLDCSSLWQALEKILIAEELAVLARSIPEFSPFMQDARYYIN